MIDAVPGSHMIERDALLGCEFAGRLADGTRIMGTASGMALATTLMTTPMHYWRVPDAWTMRQAATVVVAYTTAYYALCVRGAQV
jgi:fatty acid synthase